ncbi:hypothetical protein ACWEN4_01825 [Streptomyces violaceorubidus]
MSLPDSHVRAVTERAVASVRDLSVPRGQAAQAGRGAVSGLPGFRKGDAIASAILTSAAPTRMAVYDRHVQRAIDDLGLNLSDEPGRYGRYMDLLETLLKKQRWARRRLDSARCRHCFVLDWKNTQ